MRFLVNLFEFLLLRLFFLLTPSNFTVTFLGTGSSLSLLFCQETCWHNESQSNLLMGHIHHFTFFHTWMNVPAEPDPPRTWTDTSLKAAFVWPLSFSFLLLLHKLLKIHVTCGKDFLFFFLNRMDY